MKHITKYQTALITYFAAMVVFWVFIAFTGRKDGNVNYTFSFLFGLIPLVGGLVGMYKARLWGGLKSTLGRAIFFVSFGLVLWGAGESIWSYYNFVKHVAAPYPSLADIGFAPSIFFWILGTIFLAKATGAFFAFHNSHKMKIVAVLLPLAFLIPSYFIQIKLAHDGVLVPAGEPVLKVILDIAYPFGDFLALCFAAVVYALSFKYFGGLYRRAISCLLGGLAVMYIADTIFSYTTTKGTYYNAKWGDLLLAFGLFLITYGILAFASTPPTTAVDKV
jgi:hypothetical protein